MIIMIDLTRTLLFKIVERGLYFFYFFMLFVFSLYLAGNFQFFLDSTQIFLLAVTVRVSFFLFVFSLIFGIMIILAGAGRRRIMTGKFLFFLISLISGFMILFTSQLILSFTG